MRNAVLKGSAWSAVSRIGTQGLSLISAAVVARILPARAYGLMGMAQVVIGFAILFRDIGTAAAIIQRPEIEESLLSSIYWLNVALGLAVTAACWALAPLAAVFYGEPQIAPILQALSLSFAITALSNVHTALLNRAFRFARIAAAELVAGAAGVAAAITGALLGAGVWSLVAGSLTNAMVSSILLILLGNWRPRFHFSWLKVREVANFGLNLSGFNFVNYFARNADNLLVGKYLGATPLGYYGFAYNLMLYPVQAISQTLGRVLFPALAAMQHDHERFRQAYLRACAGIALVTFPLMTGLTILAPEFVWVVLGRKWMPMVPVLRILAPVGMLQSITTTTGQIYVATGRTDLMFRWGAIFSCIFVAGFAAALPWGIMGVAAGYSFLTILLLIPIFTIPFRIIDLRLSALWRTMQPIVTAIACMATVVVPVQWLLTSHLHASALVSLAACTPLGAACYFTVLYWRRSAALDDILGLLAAARRGRAARVTLGTTV